MLLRAAAKKFGVEGLVSLSFLTLTSPLSQCPRKSDKEYRCAIRSFSSCTSRIVQDKEPG